MLNKEQIFKFHQDGFLRIPNLFHGRELAELKKAVKKAHAEALEGKGKHHCYQENPDGSKTYFRSEKMWARDAVFQAVTVNPRLLECVGQCIGQPFFPVNNALVCKLAKGNVPIRWHQDPPYPNPLITETYDVPHFTVDIYLDHSNIENGCVWGIPEHHLVGHIDLIKYRQKELFDKKEACPLTMKPGDVLFHCLSSPHGSEGNKTLQTRSTLYLQFITRELFFQTHYVPFGEKNTLIDMLNARQSLGFDDFKEGNIRLVNSDREFEFTGEPRTEAYYWKTLKQNMSTEEKVQKRNL